LVYGGTWHRHRLLLLLYLLTRRWRRVIAL
jgi:hypothetical protein